ncbi:MAG: TIGR03960 family B12-binding radical SAM protein [Candidatus Aminicenantes bacterium]|nr:TIGR03960 family B12-binding radical SAM protein [Candidatus Aminicenantes bacterium]NIM77575.1 TIGR03960 family B12-binding radical SAM protein [Candidatus Aminicenantes bacterium]NIN20619.1 TIGR03960 family B12-binding radical SAM protein [Candidatus Aminicenantes bacterium]NIN44398.1 TIGR03960 family B12-binding radical SAM protein [Candidatus Aminicenantes bacterium]NIN87217.1 TIGR03960 family B12-binding radical SAM protein [Candidatus Aminicenantes bacterium]
MINIDEFIFKLENPQVYTGREINVARKEISPGRMDDFIHVCLVFPDKYEIGMSHYGLIILYHLLNNMKHVNAERCFLPGKPSIQAFKQYSVPLFSLENKIPLKNFDIIGFSLLAEMNYTNVLQVLDLAGIPLRTRERRETFPIIAAGGISTVNPEPLREFIDVFGIGDGEALFPDIIEVVSEAKEKKLSRNDVLKRLDAIESLYVPFLYPPVKRGRFYVPDLESGKIKKRVIKTIEDFPEHDRVIVPLVNVVFNRLNVEIARGCPQNCRFCQAKSYYAPYRSRPLEQNIRQIAHGLRETGFGAFSLSTLSTGDYPDLQELLELIPDVIALAPGVKFSLSSLRPSTLSHQLLSTIALFKRTGITIVPEAGTQRLRNVINKNVTDEEIFQAVELTLRNKWQKIKIYFMLGLPNETMEDIDGIVRLIRKMVEMSRGARQKIKIHASFSPFVPKPQTPLQWAPRENFDNILEKARHIKEQLRPIKRFLDLDFHIPYNSVVETLLARGDYRVGELLLAAFQKGEIFSAWDQDFNFPVWEGLMHGSDHDYDVFLQEIPMDEPLPWDFLEVNFRKEYLQEEYCKALAGEPTPTCGEMACNDCKGCIYGMKRREPLAAEVLNQKIRELKQEIAALQGKSPGPEPAAYNKIRIFYEKTGDFIFFSQLSMMQYIERLIRRAGIAFKCSKGFTPRIKISSLPALPVFAAGLEEVVELFVDVSLKENEILDLLNKSALPEGFKFKNVIVCNDVPPLSRDIHLIGYEIIVKELPQRIHEISQYLEDTDFASYSGDRLILKIDYSNRGQERFTSIYRAIDPEKKNTRYLTRTHVRFKS